MSLRHQLSPIPGVRVPSSYLYIIDNFIALRHGIILVSMTSNSTDFEDRLNRFGPTSPDTFDFTALFENAFLSIAPSTLLLLILTFRLLSLREESQKVSRSLLQGNKLVCSETSESDRYG